MRILRILRLRLRSLFARSTAEAEARREMDLHVEQLMREKLAAGMAPAEARSAALREMGNLGQLADRSRDARGVRYLHDLADDLGFALRLLRKSPAFTAVSVLSLGLGIGANTAIFTLIKRSYLEMLPVRDPEQMVRITRSNINSPESSSFTYPLYREMREAPAPFEGLICTAGGLVSLVGADGVAAESISIQLVSGNFHQLLGVRPLVGRLFTPDDDRHPGAHPVIVLSHNYWRRRFASDPEIVGKRVRVNTHPMTVIGVSPPGFDGLGHGWSPDAVIPVMMQAQVYQSRSSLEDREHWWLNVAGRLKVGTTHRQAELALLPQVRAYFQERTQQPGTSAYVRSMYESNRVQVRPMATGWHRDPASAANSMALLGITGIVLFAACLNLANLLLARASARRSEIAMRLALGAGRFRLLRQLLTESLLLAVLGAGFGLALAFASGPFVLRLAKGDDPQLTQSAMPDLTVLLFTLAVATVCGVLFGLAPAWQAARMELNQGIGARRTAAGTKLLGRKMLLSAQIALTLLLLAGAGLFVRTLRNMRTADLGFAPEHLLQLTLMPRNAGYSNAQVLPYMHQTIERIRSVPGVRSASLAAVPVMANGSWGSALRIQGVTIPENQRGPDRNAVGPRYFSTMGIPMVLGREFDERDGEAAPKVAIVNEAFVRFYFGNQNPLGRRIDQGGDPKEPPRFTIVGVAKDGKYRGVRDETTRFWYIPVDQSTMRNFLTVYVRTTGDPARAIAGVRRAIADVDANVAALNVRTLEAQIAEGQRFERMIAWLAAFFGVLAAALAAIGLYGILSYLVNQRQREIGVRLALGATPMAVARLVVSSVAAWTALGIVLALPAIYYGSNAVRDILFEVRPMDPLALLCAAGTLAGVASLAAWLPARRAASVEPAVALRIE
ncbi:MAG: ABC transporter permease [Bryobacteraceae bacterium]